MDKERKVVDNWQRNMRLLKWAAVLMPALFFVLIDLIWGKLSVTQGRSPDDFFWVHVVIAATAIIISYTLYTFINRLQRSLIQANRDSAIVEERERTAREMHDGVGQLLGYINAQTIAVRTLLAKGQLTEAREELANIENIARDLYADVREEILGLRVVPEQKEGLIQSLREYAERYSEMCGIKVEIDVGTGAHCPKLNPSVEIQLIRITQEALTNVRKHAKATTAVIRFERNGDELCLTIADNGCGFDVTCLPLRGWPRFGLQVMKERAEAVKGNFSIESSPGKGCRILLRVPLSYRKQEAEMAL